MKERLLLPKDLLEPYRIKFINMTSISKNKYINKLDGIAKKDNHIYHSTITIKPADVK